MTASSEGFLGRRLLSVRNRIASESDPSRLRKLHWKEIRILIQLGNLPVADDICDKLISENPLWSRGYSLSADLACRVGKWNKAEMLFDEAALKHENNGNVKAAIRLRTGPIYRLAEARGDYKKCSLLSSCDGELANILRIRSERLLGNKKIKLPFLEENWLAKRLLTLEKAWKGISRKELLSEALEWNITEPEWRWRFIVESINIWKEIGLDLREWRGPIKGTICPVLDPRFNKEWRKLSND